MDKNSILAVVLSLLFLIFWWGVVYKPTPNYPKLSEQPVSSPKINPTPSPEITEKPVSIKKLNDITWTGDSARIIISAEDGGIKSFVPTIKKQFDLVANGINIFSSEGLVDKITTINHIFKIQQKTPGFQIQKEYNFQSLSGLQTVRFQITNTGNTIRKPGPIYLAMGINTDEKDQRENIAITRVNALLDSPEGYLIKLKPGTYPLSNYRWIAVNNRYFTLTFIPRENQNQFFLNLEQKDKKTPPVVYLTTQKDLLPGQSVSFTVDFYFGPKIYSHLKKQGNHLEKVVDFGLFSFLGKWALWLLNKIYGVIGNYGWAIVLFTIILQILVFPLTRKSLKATVAMKKIQPQLQLLQKQYRNDPQRLNAELLNLYRRHGINPLGGCLPMLLQLPIFWALFTTLRNAYELRGAHWIFWIKDLSTYDPYYILPILMGALMFIQQISAGATSDPTQKQMAFLMPVLFTFLFAKFPAGLVLYWTVNSLLTLILQFIIVRQTKTVSASGTVS